MPNAAARHLIDERLDALDQALLGLLPRTDRLAMVAQVESRVRELGEAIPTIPQSVVPAFGGLPSSKKSSRLAISSGVLGILALVLLFGIPVTYFLVATVGELLGEIVSMAFLGAHLLAVTIGGVVAAGLGTAALVTLGRHRGNLAGRGWAIAGLCTGPVAMFLGGSVLIVGGFEMLGAEFLTGAPVAQSASPEETEQSARLRSGTDSSDSDEPDTPMSRLPPIASGDRPNGFPPSPYPPTPIYIAPSYGGPASQAPPGQSVQSDDCPTPVEGETPVDTREPPEAKTDSLVPPSPDYPVR
jgi:hypothetical protein